jgi:hypothetical protein
MKSNNQDKTFQQFPVCLKLKSLPAAVRERLIKRQSGETEGFVFKTGGFAPSYFLIAAAVGWFGLFFFLANDLLWGSVELGVFGVLSAVAAFLLVDNLYKLVRLATAPLGKLLLVTPMYVIDIDFNDIRYWTLEQIDAIRRPTHGQNVDHQTPQIILTLENGSQVVDLKDAAEAEQTIEQITYYRKLLIEATVRNNTEYLDSIDDFKELRTAPAAPVKSAPAGFLPRLAVILGSLVLTAGIMFAGISLNNYFDDKKSWQFAEGVNTAVEYRKYLQTHPQGRWRGDAGTRLQGLYDEAEQKYRASLNEEYDKAAVEAVAQVLRYAKETQNYRVKIVFERRNEIPPDLVAKLKKAHEVKTVIELDDSFSDEKMNQSEGRLFGLIAEAFKQVISDDILEFSGDCPGECVTFLVKYKLDSDSIYYDLRQKDVPRENRAYHPGIYFDWNFSVQIPNQPRIYDFSLESNPAETLNAESTSDEDYDPKMNFVEILNADRKFFYPAMLTSAFDDFKANLVFRLGIGLKPANIEKEEFNPLTIATPNKSETY